MKLPEPAWKLSEKEVLHEFSFLQDVFYFPKFSKSKIKDEYSISTRKGHIEFNCLIFMFDDGIPFIWVINHNEEPDYSDTWPSNFYWIHDFDPTNALKELMDKGRDFIKPYVSGCAEILRNHPDILEGKFS
ncbi:hypothetical protein [Winogradskyella sp.]|uniref:hypothetical protein n=1 Tax=Winogradskyella sp. TaxID=1883156 RepID=UPI003BAD0C62